MPSSPLRRPTASAAPYLTATHSPSPLAPSAQEVAANACAPADLLPGDCLPAARPAQALPAPAAPACRARPLAATQAPPELACLSVSALRASLASRPSWQAALIDEATRRWDAWRIPPLDRFASRRLEDPHELLLDLQAHSGWQARRGQDHADLLPMGLAAGLGRAEVLTLVFTRLRDGARKMVGARISNVMPDVLPSTFAAQLAIPLAAVADAFAEQGVPHALGYLDLLLDICATAPANPTARPSLAAPPGSPLRHFIDSVAWAHAFRAAITQQVKTLKPSPIMSLDDPFGQAVRFAVGMDHDVALEALADLPPPGGPFGRNHLYMALAAAMDAGSVRCARWLVGHGVQINEEDLEDPHHRVRRAREHLAALPVGHGPEDFVTDMHRRRLDVAKICGRIHALRHEDEASALS